MERKEQMKGHVAAFVTIFIWGTTFISTKVLLQTFAPIEILFLRFVIGYLALWVVKPHVLKTRNKEEEKYFIGAGLCGVTLYYLLENIALIYTGASNVGVVISISPFFTAIFSKLIYGGKRPHRNFYFGFLIAICGICLISFGGGEGVQLHPVGDGLALLAAVVWALYAVLTRKIGEFGYDVVRTTRRTFFYGLLFMIPTLAFTDFHIPPGGLVEWRNLGNILFLGLGASALCFVTWNFAVKKLGSVRTSIYIYLVPVITTAASAFILHERLTAAGITGICLTLSGLFLSESGQK